MTSQLLTALKSRRDSIVDGTLDDRTSCYQFPQPLPLTDNYFHIIRKLVYHLTIGKQIIITYLGDFNDMVQSSHKYLFHVDPTSDSLVDMWCHIIVEHKIGPTRRNRIRRFGYPDFPANERYTRLPCFLVGDVITAPPPTPPAYNVVLHQVIDVFGDKRIGRTRTNPTD